MNDFPEVENAVSLSPLWGPGMSRPVFSVRHEDIRFDEAGFYSADSTFFDVFSFALLKGDPKEALKSPGGVVITREIAMKYFGTVDAIGKTLILEYGNDFAMIETTHFAGITFHDGVAQTDLSVTTYNYLPITAIGKNRRTAVLLHKELL